jgi:hypothetical protein
MIHTNNSHTTKSLAMKLTKQHINNIKGTSNSPFRERYTDKLQSQQIIQQIKNWFLLSNKIQSINCQSKM